MGGQEREEDETSRKDIWKRGQIEGVHLLKKSFRISRLLEN